MNRWFIILPHYLILTSNLSFSQSDSLFVLSKIPLFQSDSLITLNLNFDINSVSMDVGEYPRYHNIEVSYLNELGMTDKIEAEVRSRGIFRKDNDNCNFPPLIIKFNTRGMKSTLFEGVERIKLVTHCQNTIARFQDYILKEYLIYKVYNLLTPYSFEVRLCKINYINCYENYTITKYAFFVEPDEILAQRFNGVILNRQKIHPNATENYSYTLMSVFQYMIGNTDWSIKALHNIKLLETYSGSPAIPIPYDFDFSGMVNSSYASPIESLPIKNVRERYYNGYCRTFEQYSEVIERFKITKNAIYQLINEFLYLSLEEKQEILNYFDEFYRIIESPKKIGKEFVKKCRTD